MSEVRVELDGLTAAERRDLANALLRAAWCVVLEETRILLLDLLVEIDDAVSWRGGVMARSGVQTQARTAGDRPLDQRTETYMAPLRHRSRVRNRNVQASNEDTWEEMRSDAWA